MGNWIKKGVVAFSIATARTEKEALSQRSEELDSFNDGIVSPYHRNQLMSDLKEGRLTQQVKEFREKHYLVLKEAEKYKIKWGKDGDFKVLNEEEIKSMKNAKGDPYDSYPVEVTIDNRAKSKGLFEEESVRPIKVQRGVFPRHKIEQHAETVLVRDIDGKNKLIEFYIPILGSNKGALAEAQNLIKNPGVSDFVNITKMNFTTPGGDMLTFEYKMLAFDKVVEWNGNYVVKMFAECLVDGRWAAEKYMLNG